MRRNSFIMLWVISWEGAEEGRGKEEEAEEN
jgi:hypothetical protein